MNDKEFIKYITKEENLIDDFEDYLKENNEEITMNWKINDKCINKFLKALPIKDKNIINKLYEELDNYCCQIPF